MLLSLSSQQHKNMIMVFFKFSNLSFTFGYFMYDFLWNRIEKVANLQDLALHPEGL